MSFLKDILKHVYYKRKLRNKNVEFYWGTKFSGSDLHCEGYNVFGKHVIFKGEIGYGSYIGDNSNINATIGRYCSISSNVVTISGTHPSKQFVSTHPAFYSIKKQAGFTYVTDNLFQEDIFVDDNYRLATIGNDVWIGSNVLILPGIHIGDGSIIASGAVVTKDVLPYSIVGGVPAKVIRMRFNNDQIDYLKKYQWWNKDTKWLKDRVSLFSDVETFIEKTKQSNCEQGGYTL